MQSRVTRYDWLGLSNNAGVKNLKAKVVLGFTFQAGVATYKAVFVVCALASRDNIDTIAQHEVSLGTGYLARYGRDHYCGHRCCHHWQALVAGYWFARVYLCGRQDW